MNDFDIRFSKLCKLTGCHSWIRSEKEGTVVCKYCGMFAKVGAAYLRTGEDKYLIMDRKETSNGN